jgi:hypothetical protein
MVYTGVTTRVVNHTKICNKSTKSANRDKIVTKPHRTGRSVYACTGPLGGIFRIEILSAFRISGLYEVDMVYTGVTTRVVNYTKICNKSTKSANRDKTAQDR